MSLTVATALSRFPSFPRVSGDEPWAVVVSNWTDPFSPRERG